MNVLRRPDRFHDTLVVANVLSLLAYSPNFISVVFPVTKALQLLVFVLTGAYLLVRPMRRVDVLTALFALFLAFIVLSASVNYLRFANTDSLYLALSYVVKALNVVMLFQLCKSTADLDRMLKLVAMTLVGYAAHGVGQFVVAAFGLVSSRGTIEMQGYEFVDLGWAGIYRVAFQIGDINLIRIQSFFQEPGFFAFYLMFALVLLDFVSARVPFARRRLCSGIILLALTLTLSLTGIALTLAYLLVRTRSVLLRVLAVGVALYLFDFIVFNESEFIGKAGSFDMRLEHYSLIETVASSWENILFGIGFGNEALLSDMRVNNFVPELLMYSTAFGLLTVLAMLLLAMRKGRQTNHILLMVLLYSLSTPMLWSPLFVLALFLSWRVPRSVARPAPTLVQSAT